jgi:NAD(P)-dependent dehydrogenase (short-subunit alcohol dehydrogenase family)
MHGLAEKVVVVAGGATGIGAATAARLAREGVYVVVGDVNEVRGDETVRDIVEEGGRATFVGFDIADEGSVRSLIETARSSYGRVDGLFSNAADLRPEVVLEDHDVVSLDVAVWQRTLAVNLTGFFHTARHAIPIMLDTGGGSIVVTSSSAAFSGAAERPAYATSKAGLGALVRHIATRWGKEGIRCNAVAPGPVLSEVFRAQASPGALEQLGAPLCLPRFGEPGDIGAMVTFLLSEEAGWLTGQVLSVDGGMLLR